MKDLLDQCVRYQAKVQLTVLTAIQTGRAQQMSADALLQHIAQEVTHITLTSDIVRDDVREMYMSEKKD